MKQNKIIDKILFQVNNKNGELHFILNSMTEIENRALSNLLYNLYKKLDEENNITLKEI